MVDYGSSSSSMDWATLPMCVLRIVFMYLNIRDRMRAERVNLYWRYCSTKIENFFRPNLTLSISVKVYCTLRNFEHDQPRPTITVGYYQGRPDDMVHIAPVSPETVFVVLNHRKAHLNCTHEMYQTILKLIEK